MRRGPERSPRFHDRNRRRRDTRPSVGFGRDYAREEEWHDNYFGNNDPANVAESYEYESVYDSEAGIGYADSVYRRRRPRHLPDHDASYELHFSNYPDDLYNDEYMDYIHDETLSDHYLDYEHDPENDFRPGGRNSRPPRGYYEEDDFARRDEYRERGYPPVINSGFNRHGRSGNGWRSFEGSAGQGYKRRRRRDEDRFD